MFNTSCGGDPHISMQWIIETSVYKPCYPTFEAEKTMQESNKAIAGSRPESSRVVPSRPEWSESCVFRLVTESQVGCLQSQQTIWAEHPPKTVTQLPFRSMEKKPPGELSL